MLLLNRAYLNKLEFGNTLWFEIEEKAMNKIQWGKKFTSYPQSNMKG